MRHGFGLDFPETVEDACDPAVMAVIVYDMRAGVVRQPPDGAAGAVERASRVLTAARAGGYPVFFTRHMSLPVSLIGHRYAALAPGSPRPPRAGSADGG